MRLAWLELRDVRSYAELAFEPGDGVNVLIGDNGSGKTTILEAIGYLATLRSFRRDPDASLVREGAEAAVIRGEFSRRRVAIRIEAEVPVAGRRRVLLNGKRPAGRAALVAEVPVVSFLPDDLDLVKRGPALRREFVDDTAAGLRPSVAADQDGYDRALRQRNALLRRSGRDTDAATLGVWDERIAGLGAAVIAARLELLRELMPEAARVVDDIGGAEDPLGYHYEGAGIGAVQDDAAAVDLQERLGAGLGAARRVDLDRRTTTVGPHRDEIVVTMGRRDVRTRASQGEQRSAALGLRVASYELLARRRGEPPVLLLDDVFSELDPGRSRRLVERLPSGQVFVTSARSEEVPMAGDRWVVAAGAIEEAG